MRVFVTGASGWVGSHVVTELKAAGHTVLGLVRSEANAKKLQSFGAEPHFGSLEDLDSIKSGASVCDGVIHCGFIHDFNRYVENCNVDRAVIEAIGNVLAGSNKPFIVTAGCGARTPGRSSTEEDPGNKTEPMSLRVKSEDLALSFASKGVRAAVIRLPPSVFGKGDKGFVPMLIHSARQKGASMFVGDGANKWPAVHVKDAANLYRLVLEKGEAGKRYHAMGDEGVPFKEIAEAIARGLKITTESKTLAEATEILGFVGHFTSVNIPNSSALTRQRLGWRPTQPGLIADINSGHLFEQTEFNASQEEKHN